MPYTIRISSTPLIHAPGMFDFILRGAKDAKGRRWAREAFTAYGTFTPAVVDAIIAGQAIHEADSDDASVLLVTVRSALGADQAAHEARVKAEQVAAANLAD